jgi:hypothetical protein
MSTDGLISLMVAQHMLEKMYLYLLNFNLTDMTVLMNVKHVTSTLFNHINTTLVAHQLVFMSTPLLSTLSNTSPQALSTCPELTMQLFF